MLSGGRGREVPFDVRCSGYERNIVQVDDLPGGCQWHCGIYERKRAWTTFSCKSNFGYKNISRLSSMSAMTDRPFDSSVLW